MDSLSILSGHFLKEFVLLSFKEMSFEEEKKAREHENALENKKAKECYLYALKYFNKYIELFEKPPEYFEKSFADYNCKHIQYSTAPSC